MQMGKVNKFGILNLIGLTVLVLVLMLVAPIGVMGSRKNLHKVDGENKQMVLELWNIDTFAGGSISKKDFLEKVSVIFESSHSGVYINCKNMTLEEFSYAVGDNKKPDLISFGFGAGNSVKPLLQPLDIMCDNVKQEVKLSGISNGEQYAVGYLMGGYSFFTTAEKLASTTKEDIVLSKDYYTCGYDISLRKSKKHVYGLCVSNSNYLSPLRCIEKVIDDEIYIADDEYNAYLDFLGLNKSTILLGTQRDLVRLENKIENGSLSDLIMEPVARYNDLIQYVGLVNSEKEENLLYAKEFIEFLICESSQRLLKDSGLFSVVVKDLYDNATFKNLENVVWSVINIPCVF